MPQATLVLMVCSKHAIRDPANHCAAKKRTKSSKDAGSTSDTHVAPYDAFKQEGRPKLAIYHPSFAQAEQLVTTVCDDFFDAFMELQRQGYSDEELENICNTLRKMFRQPQTQYAAVLPIACLGPAGVGKSSAVNSMISQQAVAVESDWGSRGTNVVHEYKAAKPGQMSRYVVEVRYAKEKQIRNLVKKHCKAALAFQNLTHDQTRDMMKDELDDMQARYDTAIDFFYNILCNRDDFEDAQDVKDFFAGVGKSDGDDVDDDDDGDATTTIDELFGYVCESLSAKNLTSENVEAMTAETEAELNNLFAQISGPRVSVSTEDKRRVPSLWPLIITVAVHQDRDLLKAGVVLADTPGVTDTNQSVVQATKSYLKRAGTVLVFAHPSRIVSDPNLEANLRECIGQVKMHNTYLIVTTIDQKSTFKDAEKSSLLPEDLELLTAAENHVKDVKEELEARKTEKESCTTFAELKTVDKVLRELELQDTAASKGIKQVCVEIRNRMIRRDLKSKFRDLSGSKRAPDLKIFFVSNTEYQKHLAGYDRKDPPTLDIEATGIPEVRRMLYSVPTRGKSHTLGRIINSRLPSIFSGIQGILTKSRLERKLDVAKLINKVLGDDALLLDAVVKEVKARFRDRVFTFVSESTSLPPLMSLILTMH